MGQLLDKQAGPIVYKPPARIQSMTHRGVNETTLGQTDRTNCVQAATRIQMMTHRGVNETTLGQTDRNNCVQAASKDSDDDP